MHISSPKYGIFSHCLSKVDALGMKTFDIHLFFICISFSSNPKLSTRSQNAELLILAGCKYIYSPAYTLFAIFLSKIVSFKQATQISARELLAMKAINMHVFLCFLETRKHFSQGDVIV